MLGTIISILGGVNTGLNVYSKVSAILKGNESERYLKEISSGIRRIDAVVERLSDRILYASNLNVICDINNSQQKHVDSFHDIKELLEPVQRTIGEDILSSAMICSPEKMQSSMQNNPWEVLENITPISLASSQPNPNKIPILFNHDSNMYVGWQMKGILPLLFDCNYDEVNLKENLKEDQFYVLANSIGIETFGGELHLMLYKGMKLPANYKEIFSTNADDQPAISLNILSGDKPMADQNKVIGRFELVGIPPAQRGVPQLEVSLFIDYEGILTISAVDMDSGKYISETFRDISVKRTKKESAKKIINCPKCLKKMRVPSYLNIRSTCPHCYVKFDVKFGKIGGFKSKVHHINKWWT